MAHEWAEQLMEDHERTERTFEAVRKLLDAPNGPEPEQVRQAFEYFTGYVDGCHNKKEEEHLFPLIEERGVPSQGGPLAVMLQEHETSRQLLQELVPIAEAYADGDRSVLADLREKFVEYSELLKNHFWKENDILYPMAKRVMTSEDQQAVLEGIGKVEARVGLDTRKRFYNLSDNLVAAGEVRDLVHGVDLDLLGAMLNTLPFELSLVDADDKVRYFSHENGKKLFPRSRGVIGMSVQNCHPGKSVHLVNKILEDFKAGKREVAEFWIDMGGRKVHIRYWPIRSPSGTYLGCVETTQDITDIQKIEGQRRLLDDA